MMIAVLGNNKIQTAGVLFKMKKQAGGLVNEKTTIG
jgi:hypothetical protein